MFARFDGIGLSRCLCLGEKEGSFIVWVGADS